MKKCPKCNRNVQPFISGKAGAIFESPGSYANDYAEIDAPACGCDKPCRARDMPYDNKPCDSGYRNR